LHRHLGIVWASRRFAGLLCRGVRRSGSLRSPTISGGGGLAYFPFTSRPGKARCANQLIFPRAEARRHVASFARLLTPQCFSPPRRASLQRGAAQEFGSSFSVWWCLLFVLIRHGEEGATSLRAGLELSPQSATEKKRRKTILALLFLRTMWPPVQPHSANQAKVTRHGTPTQSTATGDSRFGCGACMLSACLLACFSSRCLAYTVTLAPVFRSTVTK